MLSIYITFSIHIVLLYMITYNICLKLVNLSYLAQRFRLGVSNCQTDLFGIEKKNAIQILTFQN